MRYITLFFLPLFFIACTPKTVEPIEEVVKPVVEIDPNEPCRTWNGHPRQDEIIEAHVLYRDFLKMGKFDEAYPLWQKAYLAAPMADGRRSTHYEDGIKLNYHYFIKTQDAQYRKAIFDDLMPNMRACAKKPGYAAGRQAFDLYYDYPELATDREIYELFKIAINEGGVETEAYIMNPFIKVLADLHLSGDLSLEEARSYVQKIHEAMIHGLENCGDDCEDWSIVNSYVPGQMDRLESVEGFYDCDYYIEKYYVEFSENSADCEIVDNAYIRMKWGGCSEDNEKFSEVAEVKQSQCRTAPLGDIDLAEGRSCLESGDYNCAMAAYQRYVDKTDDNEKKAIYTLRMAKIAYAHLKNFPKARALALKAAKYKSNWGEPYMLIGNLYASSGPLCGPGTGWDSQIVTWPAIDKWNLAKKIDPTVTSNANRLIGKYSKYMPSVGDIFQRGLKQGQTFKVGCWINESTTIRAAK
jgi:tetratricopeptide (TPR) repeat protein